MNTSPQPLSAEELASVDAIWLALCERVASTKDKSEVKRVVMVSKADIAASVNATLQAASAREAVLLAFCDKVRCMSTGGTWEEMLNNDVDLMKEANALCEEADTAARDHLAEVEGLREDRAEYESYIHLVYVDAGSNNRVTWKERAETAEAELAKIRERLRTPE